MYVAVKGGEKAIGKAHELLARERRGSGAVAELTIAQIREQLTLAVDRVMTEGSLYDPDLAALAIKQARGDVIEAVFLLRAYRTTLPRLGVSEPIETTAMEPRRRISAAFKDLPGGQVLGPTFDYTHRLLDFSLLDDEPGGVGDAPRLFHEEGHPGDPAGPMAGVASFLSAEGLIEPVPDDDPDASVGDLTRDPLTFPAGRDLRLQNLARGDEGFVMSMGYSVQRGFGKGHPFVAEIRMGETGVSIVPEELGFAVDIGDVMVTECQMVNKFDGGHGRPAQFTRGYGLTFGFCERKAMAMSIVDRAMRGDEFGERLVGPAQDQEFVLSHSDSVEASGFVQHLKLPHHVDFQAELDMVRALRKGRPETGTEED